MSLNTDRSGGGVRWFFGAVLLFIVAYFHREVWGLLTAAWQVFVEPLIYR
jgi:hypothetical protein